MFINKYFTHKKGEPAQTPEKGIRGSLVKTNMREKPVYTLTSFTEPSKTSSSRPLPSSLLPHYVIHKKMMKQNRFIAKILLG
jgi:hypothetical protein